MDELPEPPLMGSDCTPSLAERLEAMVDDRTPPGLVGTHSEGCWRWHASCALNAAAVAVREREELAERVSAALSRRVSASGGSDRFLIGGEARQLLSEARDALSARDST